jgi:hypothetical protein
MNGYPRGLRSLLWLALAALFVTGLLLAPSMLETRLEWGLPWRESSDARLWTAAVHAFFAFALTCVFGAVAAIHVRARFRSKGNRATGLMLLSGFLALVLTALGIYYLGDRELSVWASVIHLVLGLLAPVTLGVHAVSVWRRLRRRERNNLSPQAVQGRATMRTASTSMRGVGDTSS